MDSQQTYLLNGLLARQFTVGRIVRSRQAQRGRQAETFELFTAQEHEYLVSLYPPHYDPGQLDKAAETVNKLDEHRFSVVPFLRSKEGAFAGEGPQNRRMLVSLAPAGTALAAAQYSAHAISQVGLRLAWMHRLMKEQIAAPEAAPTGAARFLFMGAAGAAELLAALHRDVPAEQIQRLRELCDLPVTMGWAHGDIQPLALLHDGDQQLRIVMDWGLLHYGCPLEDVVDAFLFLATTPAGALDIARGQALLESYDTLVPIRRVAWTPVVASWCAQRFIDLAAGKREVPAGFFEKVMPEPEQLATALASCL